MMDQRALFVTGATGFIGGLLVSSLLDEGHAVHVLARRDLDPGDVDARATVHVATTAEAIAAAVASSSPDTCLHLASLYLATHEPSDIPRLVESNVTFGTLVLDAFARAGGRRFITTGTAWQHFESSSAVRSVNLYAATKSAFDLVLDWYADTYRMHAATVLLPDTYGPHDPRRKVAALLLDAAANGTHLGMSPGEQLLDIVHVDDVVAAFRLAVDAVSDAPPGSRAEWGVTSGAPLSLQDLATLCADVTGASLDVAFGERPYRDREVMVPWTPAAVVPGWEPKVPLAEGLRALAATGATSP